MLFAQWRTKRIDSLTVTAVTLAASTAEATGVTAMPLTATAIRNAKPGKKPKRLHDSGGLYLEVSPSGGRWWRFAYRFGGKRKLLSVGVFQHVSLAIARKRRDEARALLADRVDPSTAPKSARRAAEGRTSNT